MYFITYIEMKKKESYEREKIKFIVLNKLDKRIYKV